MTPEMYALMSYTLMILIVCLGLVLPERYDNE